MTLSRNLRVVVAAGTFLSSALAVRSAFADLGLYEGSALKAAPVAPLAARPFELEDVRLLDGPFRHAMELDREYILSLDPDRLLHTFRLNAGLVSTARPLGGWEKPDCEVRGHFLGHYLSAAALLYASTGDERLKERAAYAVAELSKCQRALKSGYLSAYPESFLDRVENLQPVWAPYYTLHKILAGLLEVYVHCRVDEALVVAKRFGDWAIARNDRLTDDDMQMMLGNEHGGMNEALANLYALTGEAKYLRVSRRFNHMEVIGPAARRRDALTGLHANTQVPKFIGTARQYELTGREWLRAASEFFWSTVVRERSYVIGGHSDGEMFTPKERLSEALGPNTTETCNTYNMLKLTRHLFAWSPRVEIADYYERALYNHILASQNPETGMTCYYVPLRSGSRKEYSTPEESFWCCTGTGVENHAKYGDSIYFHDGGSTLYVNLFIASELSWRARGVRVRQETRFPEEPKTRLVFACEKPVDLTIRVRRPGWALGGFEVRSGGEVYGAEAPSGSYVAVARTWKTGDSIEVEAPFSLRVEGFRDNPRRFAFLHGPLVLCAEVKLGRPFPSVVGSIEEALGVLDSDPEAPWAFVARPGAFRVPGGGAVSVRLEPFYKVHGPRHYVVYWDLLSPEEWKAKEAERLAELARERELEARTVDRVVPGDEASERAHGLRGENTGAGEFGGRRWRHATEGGWFSYEVRLDLSAEEELSVTYWGSDAGNRDFDILV
ncbi:MAG: beta-L-arabinofuranosidase domain-containing protein [Planctomycetota bacterium]